MILDRFKDFVDPDELEIHIYEKGIYIENYITISNFSSNIIEIQCKNKIISIKGTNLIISKLNIGELYISGNIYEVILK